MHMNNYIIYQEIGKLIKKERKKKGLTQEQLASLTNYSLSFIANIESNTYQSFSIHTLYNIANALNISLHDLIPDKKEIAIKHCEIYCDNCGYYVSIPKELGKIMIDLEKLADISLFYSCPNCQEKKVQIKK